MAIAFRKLMGNAGILGVWEITESIAQLERSLIPEELEAYCQRQHISEKRKREWLATRCLLGSIMKEPEKICYRDNGAPFLASQSLHLSISHSEDFVAVYVDPANNVGVDIQKSKPSVIKGADFFMNALEKDWVRDNNIAEHNLIWSAKESIYKYLQETDLDFKRDLQICPVRMEQFGHIEAYVHIRNVTQGISLQFEWIGDYVLTWTV